MEEHIFSFRDPSLHGVFQEKDVVDTSIKFVTIRSGCAKTKESTKRILLKAYLSLCSKRGEKIDVSNIECSVKLVKKSGICDYTVNIKGLYQIDNESNLIEYKLM